ncbi:phage major tail tube protein [Fundidesulfovibrio butyratiphilus]
MATMLQVNRLANCNVYMDGTSMLGRCEEAKVPAIKSVMTEHKALGMIGKVELFSGVDKMEADFKWASFYPEVIVKVVNPFAAIALQVRGSLETWTDAGRTEEVPVVVHLRGSFKEHNFGDYKTHSPAEFPTKFAATYVKCTHNGVDLYEIDAMSNIMKIQGVDMLANYRANIGA